MKFDRTKKIDLIITAAIFIIGSILSYWLKLKPLMVFIVALIPPSVYLCLRERKNFKKLIVATLIFGAVFGFIFDFIVTYNLGWIVADLVIPYRIFGFYPVDDIFGFMIMTFAIVVFYEHFLDEYRSRKISPHLQRALLLSLVVLTVIVSLYLINSAFLEIPYVYLITGLLAIIIPVHISVAKPRFINRFIKITLPFFFVWFVIEIICLKTGGWFFPG
ncbi:MAG: hypothetical protein AAB360_02285 [Patescibacteria group bacterium]